MSDPTYETQLDPHGHAVTTVNEPQSFWTRERSADKLALRLVILDLALFLCAGIVSFVDGGVAEVLLALGGIVAVAVTLVVRMSWDDDWRRTGPHRIKRP